jgi:hypothetical protein
MTEVGKHGGCTQGRHYCILESLLAADLTPGSVGNF